MTPVPCPLAYFHEDCGSVVCDDNLPRPVVTILSIPRGPKLVRTASATALAASMLDCTHARVGKEGSELAEVKCQN